MGRSAGVDPMTAVIGTGAGATQGKSLSGGPQELANAVTPQQAAQHLEELATNIQRIARALLGVEF